MAFWILSGFATLAMAGLLALVVLRNRNGSGEPAAAYDLRVYRQQLKDLDRDVARGIVATEDAERLRTEIARRILTADAQVQAAKDGVVPPNGPAKLGAALLVLVIGLGTAALYMRLGAPGYEDYGLERRVELSRQLAATRPTQNEAETSLPPAPEMDVDPNYRKLVEELRAATEKRPDDPRGQNLLAEHEARLGNFKAAYTAKAHYIELQGGDIEMDDLVDQAELMVMAAGGYVSPEAEELLRQALATDRQNGRARYYVGVLMGQIGRPDRGFQIWAETLRDGPAGAPWIRAIQAQIEDMAAYAGVNYRPITPAPATGGPALPGPDADAVAAAQEMSTEDRQAMIENMVSGLAARLATDGGSPEEWARLINALGVLGRADDAAEIFAEAQEKFTGDAEALALLTQAMTRVKATP